MTVLLKQSDIKPLRDRLLKEQNGICPICSKKAQPPVLDHEHRKKYGGSGKIRGVLCSTCNSLLGKIENSIVRYRIAKEQLPNVLRGIAMYVEKPHLDFIHPSEKSKTKLLGKREFKKVAKYYSEKYPKRKSLIFPKSGKVNKQINDLLNEIEDL